MLNQLGYSNVRDYRGGLADWIEAGETVESVADAGSRPEPTALPIGPPLTSEYGTGPARVSLERRWNDTLLELVDRLSTFQLFLLWIGLVSACGFAYWLGAFLGKPPLADTGSPIGADLRGLADAVYFSFVTATSVGFGDVLPVGLARVLAIAEAVAALLIFGAVIAKFVSHRQDELVREIYRVTFDERLDRVQSNLHVVISELLSINTLCETRAMPIPRIATQMDSAVLLFLAELRTTHDLSISRGSRCRKGSWPRFSPTWRRPWRSSRSFSPACLTILNDRSRCRSRWGRYRVSRMISAASACRMPTRRDSYSGWIAFRTRRTKSAESASAKFLGEKAE